MLSLPQTPQALVVRKFRCARRASVARVTSSAATSRVTSATFSSHIRIWRRSTDGLSRPSPNRKPAARSMSSPGVRMVTVSGVPPIRISSGSSTASRSAR